MYVPYTPELISEGLHGAHRRQHVELISIGGLNEIGYDGNSDVHTPYRRRLRE